MKVKTRVKRFTQKVLHKFGFHLSYYHPLHIAQKAFVDNVFGYNLYQNVDDIAIDYSPLSGIALRDVGLMNGEFGFIIRELKQGDNVIDIGANVGLMTLLLVKVVGPMGSVVSFEPAPISFALLKLNTLINGLKNVTLINKAVSSTSGIENLYICPTGESDNQVSVIDLDWKNEIRIGIPIETVSLDDYFMSGNNLKIDFIKIDTQGGEYKALQGMRNLLIRNRDIRLIIEYAPYLPLWKEIEPQNILDFIRALGFKIYDLGSGNPEPVSDQYLFDTFPKDGKTHKMTNLLLKRH